MQYKQQISKSCASLHSALVSVGAVFLLLAVVATSTTTVTSVDAALIAGTLFPGYSATFPALCTQATVLLTPNAASLGPLIGTGVYDISTDLERAAIHAGLGTNGVPTTLYAYFVGPRGAFWTSTRYGMKSASLLPATATSNMGVFLSNVAGACPAILSSAVNSPFVTPLLWPVIKPACTLATDLIGAGYYHYSSDISCALDQDMFDLTTVAYIFDIGNRNLFFSNTQARPAGVTLRSHFKYVAGAGEKAFGISNSVAVLPLPLEFQFSISTFPVFVDLSNQQLPLSQATLGDVHGTNPFYSANSSVATAAWHAGCAIPGTVQLCWITPQLNATRFYASGQNTVDSKFARLPDARFPYPATGGFSISPRLSSAPSPTATPNGATTIAYLQMDRVIKGALPLVGAGVYTDYSDMQKAAFHSGERTLFQQGFVYIHDVPPHLNPPVLFSLERQGLTSQAMMPSLVLGTLLVAVSASSRTAPTFYLNETRLLVQPAVWKPNSVIGCGVYRADSDFLSAVLHSGLATFGEKKVIYVTFVSARTRFHMSTNGAFQSLGYDNSAAPPYAAFAITDFSTRGYLGHAESIVYVSATDAPRIKAVVGTGYYRAGSSDLTGAAIHAGLVQWQRRAVLYLHNAGKRTHFLASTSNQIRSVYYGETVIAGGTDAFVLSRNAYLPLSNATAMQLMFPLDPAIAASSSPAQGMLISVTHEYLIRSSMHAVGARIYQAKTTDLRVAAVIDGLVQLHERGKKLYVHWIPTVSAAAWACFPGASNMLSKSNASASPLAGPFFMLTDSPARPTAEINNAVNNGVFRTSVRYSPAKARRPVIGTHYYRYDSDVAAAAAHAGLVTKPDLWTSIYVHISGSAPFFLSTGGNSRTSYVVSMPSSEPACSFRVSSSDTALPPLDFNNFPVDVQVEYFGRIWGTNFYSMDSEVGTAALHARLVKYGSATPTTVFVKRLAAKRSVFFATTMNDVSSLGRFAFETAYVLSTDKNVDGASLVPATDNPMPLPMRLLNVPRLPQTDAASTPYVMPPVVNSPFGADSDPALDDSDLHFFRDVVPTASSAAYQQRCVGAGYYDLTSDMTLAAVHNGQLQVGELKTLYAHLFAGRPSFVGAVSRGVACFGRTGTANATVILTDSASPVPAAPAANLQVANIVPRQKPCGEDAGGVNAPPIADPFPRLHGYHRYDLDDTASGDLAAVAIGAAQRGVPSTVYFWTFDDVGFVPAGTGLSGVAASAKFTPSPDAPYFLKKLATYAVTSTAVQPAGSPSFIAVPVTVTFPGFDALASLKVYGSGGVYHYDSDVVGAAIHSGLLTSNYSNKPVELWLHFRSAPVASYVGTTVNGVRSRSCVKCYAPHFVLTPNSSAPPPTPTIRSAELSWISVSHAAVETAPYFGCYPYAVDGAAAAMKEGLLPQADARTGKRRIYFHEFSHKYAPGFDKPTECYIPSLSPSPPISLGIPVRVFGSGGPVSHMQQAASAPSPRLLVGTDRYTMQSDVYAAAFHQGLIRDGEEATLFVHVSATDYSHFFASTRHGVSSASSFGLAQRCFTISASPVPALFPADAAPFKFELSSPWVEASVGGVTGTGVYSRSSDLTFAAAHNGMFRFGARTNTGLLSTDNRTTATVYVHDAGVRRVFVGSVFDGVRSDSSDTIDLAAMILSATAATLSACTTSSATTIFAPIRGANPIDSASRLSAVPFSTPLQISGISDVPRAAAYANLVAPWTLRYVRIDITTTGASATSFSSTITGSYGIKPVPTTGNTSFTLTLDSNCALPGWPVEVTSLPATPDCSGSCALPLFPLGPTTSLGTQRIVTVAADSFSSGSQSLHGTGAYALWSDIQKAVVHAGLLYPGDIAQVTLTFVGMKTSLGSAMRGVVSYGSNGRTRNPSLMMALTSQGLPVSHFALDQDVIGPVNVSFAQLGLFRNMNKLRGAGIYRHEASTDAVAAAYHAIATMYNNTYDSERSDVYFHNMPWQHVFYGSTVGSGASAGQNTTVYAPEPCFSVLDTANVLARKNNKTISLRFNPLAIFSMWEDPAALAASVSGGASSNSNSNNNNRIARYVGAGVYPISTDCMVAAVQSGLLNFVHDTATLQVTDVGVVGSFWGHYSRGVMTFGLNASSAPTGGIALSTNGILNFTATIEYTDTMLVPLTVDPSATTAVTVGATTASSSTTTTTSTAAPLTTTTTMTSNDTSTSTPSMTSTTIMTSSTTSATTTTIDNRTSTMTATATNATSTTTTAAPAPTTIAYVNITVNRSKTVHLLPMLVDLLDVPEATRLGAKVFGTTQAYSPTSNMLLAAVHSADPAKLASGELLAAPFTAMALSYFPRAILHSQRRNGILSRGMAGVLRPAPAAGWNPFGLPVAGPTIELLESVRIELALPSRPYVDTLGPYRTEIDLGGTVPEVGRSVAEAEATNPVFGASVYGSDSEVALTALHASAGNTAQAATATKICAYAAVPGSRDESAIPGAVGAGGVRSCSTQSARNFSATATLTAEALLTAAAASLSSSSSSDGNITSTGRFTISYGGCHVPPIVEPNATIIPFNLSTVTLLDADFSTTCFGFGGLFGGDVQRAMQAQLRLSASVAIPSVNGATTVYITPLGDAPVLPTSSAYGCAAFSGNNLTATAAATASSKSGKSVIPAFSVSLVDDLQLMARRQPPGAPRLTSHNLTDAVLSRLIVRGSLRSGNFSFVANASLDASASTLFFANSGSLCKGDGVYTIDTDVLCSAYRHGVLSFGDTNKEILIDVQLSQSSSPAAAAAAAAAAVSTGIQLYGTSRRGHRSTHSGDFRSDAGGANYVSCMSTVLAADPKLFSAYPAATFAGAATTVAKLQRIAEQRQLPYLCSDTVQRFENICLAPIHSLRPRNQVVGVNPFSVNSDVVLAAVAAGVISGATKPCANFTVSKAVQPSADLVDFGGGMQPNPRIIAEPYSCETSKTSLYGGNLCVTAPGFVLNGTKAPEYQQNQGGFAAPLSSSSFSLSSADAVSRVTLVCEFEESALDSRAAGLTLWSPGTDLGLASFIQFGCNWGEVISIFVTFVPMPARMTHFVSTCAFGACGAKGLSTANHANAMVLAMSPEDAVSIALSAEKSYAVNVTGYTPFLSTDGSSSSNVTIMGAGRYPVQDSYVHLAALFEGQSMLTPAFDAVPDAPTAQQRFLLSTTPPPRMQLAAIGFDDCRQFLSTSRLGFDTVFRNVSANVLSFGFVQSPGLLLPGNETDFPTNFALSQVPARFYDGIGPVPQQGFGRYNKFEWSVPMAAMHSGLVDTRSVHILKQQIWVRSAQPGSGLPFLLGATARGITTTTLPTLTPTMQVDWFFVAMNGGELRPRTQVQPAYRADTPVRGTGDYTVDTPLSLAVIHSGIADVDDVRFLVPVEIFPVPNPAVMLVASEHGDMQSQIVINPANTTLGVYTLHQSTILPGCRRNVVSSGSSNWLVVDVVTASTGRLGIDSAAGPLAIAGSDYWNQHTLVSSAVVQAGFAKRGAQRARVNISFIPLVLGGTVFPAVLRNTLASGGVTLPANQSAYTIVNASWCEYVTGSVSMSRTDTRSQEITDSITGGATNSRTIPPTKTKTTSRTTWTMSHQSRSKTRTWRLTRSRPITLSDEMTLTRTRCKCTVSKSKSRPYFRPEIIPSFAIGNDNANIMLWAAGPVSIMAMIFGGSPVNGLYSTSALAVVEFSLCYRDNINGSLRFPESAFPGWTLGREQGQHVRGALVANMAVQIGLLCLLFAFGFFKARARIKFSAMRERRMNKTERKLGVLTSASFASPLLDKNGKSDGAEEDEEELDIFDRATQEAWYPGSYILISSIFLEGIVVSVTKLFILGPDVLDVVLSCLGLVMVGQITVVAWTVISRSFHAGASVRFCQSYVRVLNPDKHESAITQFLRSPTASTLFIGNYLWCAKKGTEDSKNNVLPLAARPAGLLVLPFRARNPDESGIIALAMRYFFVECVVAFIIGVCRGVQEPCNLMMWIVAAVTTLATLLLVRVRPFNIPFYNTTAVWTNAGIAGAAFCIASFHSGFAGENVRMAGEILAMTAALGGAFPLMLFGIRTVLLLCVNADVAPLGLQDEGSLSGKKEDEEDENSNDPNSATTGGKKLKNVGKNAGKSAKAMEEMDEFEMHDTFAKKQPVNWPLRPADEIKLSPLQTLDNTDDNLFVRRSGPTYRHKGAVWADETPVERDRREARERVRNEEAMMHVKKQQEAAAAADLAAAGLSHSRNNNVTSPLFADAAAASQPSGGTSEPSAEAASSPRTAAGVSPPDQGAGGEESEMSHQHLLRRLLESPSAEAENQHATFHIEIGNPAVPTTNDNNNNNNNSAADEERRFARSPEPHLPQMEGAVAATTMPETSLSPPVNGGATRGGMAAPDQHHQHQGQKQAVPVPLETYNNNNSDNSANSLNKLPAPVSDDRWEAASPLPPPPPPPPPPEKLPAPSAKPKARATDFDDDDNDFAGLEMQRTATFSPRDEQQTMMSSEGAQREADVLADLDKVPMRIVTRPVNAAAASSPSGVVSVAVPASPRRAASAAGDDDPLDFL